MPSDGRITWSPLWIDFQDRMVQIRIDVQSPGLSMGSTDWFVFQQILHFQKELVGLKNGKVQKCAIEGFEGSLRLKIAAIENTFESNCSISFDSTTPVLCVGKAEGMRLKDDYLNLLKSIDEMAMLLK